MKGFIDFDDMSIPLGKRKQQYVKWLMHKFGYTLDKARLLCHRKFYREEALFPSGISPRRMHYLLVWGSHKCVEVLNCSQRTRATDEILAEMHKDEYYDIEKELQEAKTKEEALAIIAKAPEHDYMGDWQAKVGFWRIMKDNGALEKYVELQEQFGGLSEEDRLAIQEAQL